MSFRLKIIFGVAAIEILLLSLLVFSGIRYLANSNEEQLRDRARTSAQLFATMTTDAVVAMDLANLDELASKAVTNPGIVYLRVRHANGTVLAEKGDKIPLQHKFQADSDISDVKDGTFDVAQDIMIHAKYYGRVELGWSTGFYQSLIGEASRYMLSVALIEVILVGIFGLLLGRILTAQLISLQRGARKVAEGELGYTINVKGNDELADTALSFNAMSEALQRYAAELKEARKKAERKQARAENLLQKAVESLPHGVVICDKNDQIMHINEAFMEMYAIGAEELTYLKTCSDVQQILPFSQDLDKEDTVCLPGQTSECVPITKLPDGRWVLHSYQAIESGGAIWVDTDVSQFVEAEERNRKLERELLHGQKMESIGVLAGGIAHEINTPIQYITDNLHFINESMDEVMVLLGDYETLAGELEQRGVSTERIQQVRATIENADLDFLLKEVPSAVEQSIDGINRVAKIIVAMKEFAHPSAKEKGAVDLNTVVERALTIGRNEYKSVAEIDLHLAKDLPAIIAHEGDLNQVLLNLIVNAAHAVANNDRSTGGLITISTEQVAEDVVLTIDDNGSGIPKEIVARIFDPFFTTKEVGKGSGQGLAICYDIVVNKHGGKIEVRSFPGKGSTFQIRLPILGNT